jgi:hypothetical protein
MIILGRTNDDKGTQLESLTKMILLDLGYSNIISNPVSSGGSELDVTADYAQPLPGNTRMLKLVCECKAHQDPTTMTDWLKFLGKLHVTEVERGEEASGCFIALSGVNGNVAGSYENYNLRKPNKVTVINENRILEMVGNRLGLCTLESATAAVRTFTSRPIKSMEVAYYEGELFWVASFEENVFGLLSATGLGLVGEKLASVSSLVETSTSRGSVVDLFAEAEAQRADTRLQKAILTMLASRGGFIPVNVTGTPEVDNERVPAPMREAVAQNDLTRIIDLLQARGWLEISTDRGELGLCRDSNGRCPVMPDIMRFMLTGQVPAEVVTGFVGTPYYDAHIDSSLVSEVQKIQGDLPLTAAEADALVEVLKLSPSALVNCLHPVQMIVQHRTGKDKVSDADVDRADVRRLFNLAYQHLIDDFRNPVLAGYFFKVRGIREIETFEKVKVKSREKVEMEAELSSRAGIGVLVEEYGGGFIHIAVLDGTDEPWASSDPDMDSIDAAYRTLYGLSE